jgi:hypothetical protein
MKEISAPARSEFHKIWPPPRESPKPQSDSLGAPIEPFVPRLRDPIGRIVEGRRSGADNLITTPAVCERVAETTD